MNHFNLFFILISSLFFSGCINNEPHEKSDMMDEILAHHKKYIFSHYPWVLSMEGGGIPDKVTLFSIGFAFIGPVDVNTARKYLIDAASNLESIINRDEKIRPHLINYPFSINNIEYELVIYDEKKHRVKQPANSADPNNLAFITLRNGKIRYLIKNEDSIRFTPVHEETYEEAKLIAEEG
ncbi:MAG: hypothetical protein H7A37_07065 [Chlamydiales bacterium]|nr:hypothetical protein [Chlamydiales bacterium]